MALSVNPFLIVVLVVAVILVFAGIFYLLVVFSSPEDRLKAWFAKIVTILAMSLACFLVLLLPFDIANREDPAKMAIWSNGGGGLDVALMWQIALWATVVMVTAVIPFAIFWYEAYDPDKRSPVSQLKPAILSSVVSVVIFIVIAVVLYKISGDGTAILPVIRQNTTAIRTVENSIPLTPFPEPLMIVEVDDNFTIQLSFFIFVPTMLCIAGWFLLLVFGGVGLTALPLELIQSFTKRPKPLSSREYTAEKRAIAALSSELIAVGEKLEDEQRKAGGLNTKLRRKVNAFKLDVAALEEQLKKLEVAWKDGGGSPLIPLGFLILGIIGIGMTVLWIIQMIVCSKAYGCLIPFLPDFFVMLDDFFGLLGTAAYAAFAFYLLWAVFKGCIKVGTRFLLFEIHPMVPNETPMNSFLFNSILILLAATAVVQFCSSTFQAYAASSAADLLFGVYVQSLKIVKYWFVYVQVRVHTYIHCDQVVVRRPPFSLPSLTDSP